MVESGDQPANGERDIKHTRHRHQDAGAKRAEIAQRKQKCISRGHRQYPSRTAKFQSVLDRAGFPHMSRLFRLVAAAGRFRDGVALRDFCKALHKSVGLV